VEARGWSECALGHLLLTSVVEGGRPRGLPSDGRRGHGGRGEIGGGWRWEMTPTGGSRVSVAEGGGRGRWAAGWFDGPEQRLGQWEKERKESEVGWWALLKK
jgi:hypothetical protein